MRDRVAELCGAGTSELIDLGGDDLRTLRFADRAVEAGFLFEALEHVPPSDLDLVIAELGRVVERYLFVQVNRAAGTELALLSRIDWERRFFAAGWSKHPRYQSLTPYESLEHENDTSTLLLAFERLPEATRQRFPLAYLAVERDLHMDMLREAGRRSDAHVVRYTLAAEYVSAGDTVLDAACGLGYGSALLHDSAADVTVTGIDLSDSAIDYARVTFGTRRPRLAFAAADVMSIASRPRASVNTIASFETIEHIPDPHTFVAEAARLLVPGGGFICSVPHRWVDENGRDPNPFHLHVFDLEKLTQLLQPHLRIERVIAQFAGGGMWHNQAARRLVPVPPGDPSDAEWWVVVARAPRT